MGKIKKATKKFNKKQLHGELQRRKKIKGMKRKQQEMAARGGSVVGVAWVWGWGNTRAVALMHAQSANHHVLTSVFLNISTAQAQQQSGSDTDDAAPSSEDEFADAAAAHAAHASGHDSGDELPEALHSDESDEEELLEDDGDVMAQLDALMSGSSGGDEDGMVF